MSENNKKSYTERLVRVVTTKVIRVQVADESLTDEAVDEFSEHIFAVHRVDELFEHAAGMLAAHHGDVFIEGIGPSRPIGSPGDAPVQYDLEDVDVEIEVMQ